MIEEVAPSVTCPGESHRTYMSPKQDDSEIHILINLKSSSTIHCDDFLSALRVPNLNLGGIASDLDILRCCLVA